MEAIAGPVIAQGLADEEEVKSLVTRLDELAATPGFVATLPRIVQVSARASNENAGAGTQRARPPAARRAFVRE
jgi:hypothetical protein